MDRIEIKDNGKGRLTYKVFEGTSLTVSSFQVSLSFARYIMKIHAFTEQLKEVVAR